MVLLDELVASRSKGERRRSRRAAPPKNACKHSVGGDGLAHPPGEWEGPPSATLAAWPLACPLDAIRVLARALSVQPTTTTLGGQLSRLVVNGS